jgi:hypothetical protein
MASYQEDIASKLLHSTDARIAEAAKRVFSSSMPPAVAASLAAMSPPPPQPPSASMMDVLDDLPIYAYGEMNYARNIADRAEQYFHNNTSSSDPGNSTGGNDEVSDDYEDGDQKPSSTERLKRR